jgi:putative NADH-flavin reductase
MLTDPQGGKSNISAEDFAIAMLDEIEQPTHFRTIFNVAY